MSKPVLTIEAFTDWVARQPADQKYPSTDASNCALAQYSAFLGLEWLAVEDKLFPELLHNSDSPAADAILCSNTFGALHQRLTAVLSPSQETEE
jgi:hypothetical protein